MVLVYLCDAHLFLQILLFSPRLEIADTPLLSLVVGVLWVCPEADFASANGTRNEEAPDVDSQINFVALFLAGIELLSLVDVVPTSSAESAQKYLGQCAITCVKRRKPLHREGRHQPDLLVSAAPTRLLVVDL